MQDQLIIAHEFIRGKMDSRLHGNDKETINLPKVLKQMRLSRNLIFFEIIK